MRRKPRIQGATKRRIYRSVSPWRRRFRLRIYSLKDFLSIVPGLLARTPSSLDALFLPSRCVFECLQTRKIPILLVTSRLKHLGLLALNGE
jgi:hypothetical protein